MLAFSHTIYSLLIISRNKFSLLGLGRTLGGHVPRHLARLSRVGNLGTLGSDNTRLGAKPVASHGFCPRLGAPGEASGDPNQSPKTFMTQSGRAGFSFCRPNFLSRGIFASRFHSTALFHDVLQTRRQKTDSRRGRCYSGQVANVGARCPSMLDWNLLMWPCPHLVPSENVEAGAQRTPAHWPTYKCKMVAED